MPTEPNPTLFCLVDQPSQVFRFSGILPSARAYLVARFAELTFKHQPSSKVIVVLCPHEDSMNEFCTDLETLSLLGNSTRENPSLDFKIVQFPTWEQSPYSSVRPSLRTRFRRLSVLAELTQGALNSGPKSKQVLIIVTTLEASCQATLPPEAFQKNSIHLSIGLSIETRELIAKKLAQNGYLRTESVEDPGTFAIRGEIIDLFPPNRSYPIRIELFDETIERIREFDPVQQRTLNSKNEIIQTLFIPPAREVLISEETEKQLREKIRAHSDQFEISRKVRDPILEAVRNGHYPDHSDTWAPFGYSNPANLWSYLEKLPQPQGESEVWPVVWIDEMSCRESLNTLQSNPSETTKKAIELEMIVPPVESLFPWTEFLDSKIKQNSRLFLDQIELTETSQLDPSSQNLSNQRKISIHDHSDLLVGSRHSLEGFESTLREWIQQKYEIAIFAPTQSQLERILFLLKERDLPCEIENEPTTGALKPSIPRLYLGHLSSGFRWPEAKLIILTESEVLGIKNLPKTRLSNRSRSQSSQNKSWSNLQNLSDLSPGDTLVHVDHGIGKYLGIARLTLSRAPSDFLLVEYANKDKLYVPVYRLNLVQKYLGSGQTVALDRLGSQQFSKTKDKVKDSVKKLAIDLIQLYAERKVRSGVVFSPRDSTFREFEAQFPFEETPDQLRAIDSVLKDMESGRVMDRLVCGDVGYGKTEVALRAAFRAVTDGKQVAVLVPTTILAQQHEQSFKSRMKDYPILIESLSRFKTPKQQMEILEALKKGKVDIVIGTHRLLSKDVHFQDLGLIIVDEEHRFGVEHKERLKTLKTSTHVLTLTATPIPRTLHMALSGLRDISIINTPPIDRLPIKTYVSKYDDSLIQRAIELELSRGGQVFFLHNRVQSIDKVSKKLKELVPKAEIIQAHGKMLEHQLEDTMLQFYQKQANVLVCTTIIESGLDFPNANTIIINRADTLGLAQLYQIRGRVGRGDQRAYSYLLIPNEGQMNPEAKRRLEVMQRFVELGSGFSIASHDLEIRGGGDLLGAQQSGSIGSVGFDLYTELLEEAVREIQGKPLSPEESLTEPEIKVPFPAFLSEDYVPDTHQRLSLYRRFSGTKTEEEINQLEEELKDRFGTLPPEAQNLLWLIRIRLLLKKMGIETLTVGVEKISLKSGPQTQLNPTKVIPLISAFPDHYQLTPDSKLVVRVPAKTPQTLYFELERLLNDLK